MDVNPPTSVAKQIFVYFASFFLCPLGLWWGIKYLKQEDAGAKRIGIISIILTMLALILGFFLTKGMFNILTKTLTLPTDSYQIPGL